MTADRQPCGSLLTATYDGGLPYIDRADKRKMYVEIMSFALVVQDRFVSRPAEDDVRG